MDRHKTKFAFGFSILALIFSLTTGGKWFVAFPFTVSVFAFCYVAGRWRRILFLLFLSYQTGALGFTYMVDGHLDLLALLKYIPFFKYVAYFGFVLIVMEIACYLFEQRDTRKEIQELKTENTTLKARLYDLEGGRKSDETGKP